MVHQMRMLPVALCLLGLACSRDMTPQTTTGNASEEKKDGRVEALIKQLGDAKFATREAASKELRTIGNPALEALRKAALEGEGAEVRRRASQLVQELAPRGVRLASAHFSPGLRLAESQHPVYQIRLWANVNARGEGKGQIELITTPPNYDEFGDPVTGTEVDGKARPARNEHPPVSLDCAIEYERAGAIGRVNTGAVHFSVFRITGPKITSRLGIATTGPGLTSGRLLVLDGAKRVEHVVELNDVTPRMGVGNGLPVPCHPGCFPAGTMVRVPEGVKSIEGLRTGDAVVCVNINGIWESVKVTDVSVTRNKLLEVQTDNGSLITTQTQPIALEAGGFQSAADLKHGDRIWRIVNGGRRAVNVLGVCATDREADVFNLVLGETRVFIANDFLVRSKPPAK
jgi:hypothetical protein